jgi:hypothetical protein
MRFHCPLVYPIAFKLLILPNRWLWQWLFQYPLDVLPPNNMLADELFNDWM